MSKIINLTPHPITVGTTVIPPSGIARMAEKAEPAFEVNDIAVVRKSYTTPIDLPDPLPDTYYVVSMVVAQALPHRADLLCPGEQIRDEQGRIVGCKNLCTYCQ